jgi:glutaryl-CoA dehydrogenase
LAGAKGSIPFAWDDPFLLEAQLGGEERMIRDTARAYVQQRLAPRVRKAFRDENTDRVRRPLALADSSGVV